VYGTACSHSSKSLSFRDRKSYVGNFFRDSRSLKVIDLDTAEKLVSNWCKSAIVFALHELIAVKQRFRRGRAYLFLAPSFNGILLSSDFVTKNRNCLLSYGEISKFVPHLGLVRHRVVSDREMDERMGRHNYERYTPFTRSSKHRTNIRVARPVN